MVRLCQTKASYQFSTGWNPIVHIYHLQIICILQGFIQNTNHIFLKLLITNVTLGQSTHKSANQHHGTDSSLYSQKLFNCSRNFLVRFKVLTVTSKMAVFWNAALCRLVDTDWCLRGAYDLHHQGDHSATSQMIVIFKKFPVTEPESSIQSF